MHRLRLTVECLIVLRSLCLAPSVMTGKQWALLKSPMRSSVSSLSSALCTPVSSAEWTFRNVEGWSTGNDGSKLACFISSSSRNVGFLLALPIVEEAMRSSGISSSCWGASGRSMDIQHRKKRARRPLCPRPRTRQSKLSNPRTFCCPHSDNRIGFETSSVLPLLLLSTRLLSLELNLQFVQIWKYIFTTCYNCRPYLRIDVE